VIVRLPAACEGGADAFEHWAAAMLKEAGKTVREQGCKWVLISNG
jgi:hypothetical protein